MKYRIAQQLLRELQPLIKYRVDQRMGSVGLVDFEVVTNLREDGQPGRLC